MSVRIAAVPVPDDLHLAIDDRGRPATVPYDRGVVVEFAYSIAGDRPPAVGTGSRRVSRQSLIEDERSGRAIVFVDVAADHWEGLPVAERPRARRGLLPIQSRAAHARRMSASSGIWAEVVLGVSVPNTAWELFTFTVTGPRLHLVIDPDPARRRTKILRALGDRPHPEITIVDSVDAVPRAWRNAARALLRGQRDG